MKTILSILFLFVCAFAHAQYHNVEGIRVVGRSDSTTISNVGQIQFDADDDKFRFNDGTGWFSFLKEGATLPYWKTSGFTVLDDNIQITLPFDLSGDADSLSIRSEATLGPAAFTTWFVDETNLLYYLRLGVDLNAPVARYLKFNADYIGAEGTVFFHEVGGTKTGIQYYDYDSTAWTSSTLTTKGYVDGKFDGKYWPLSGTETLTGNVTIDADDNNLNIYDANRVVFGGFSGDQTINDFSINTDTAGVQMSLNMGSVFRVRYQSSDAFTYDVNGFTVSNALRVGGDIDVFEDGSGDAIMGTATLSSGTVTVNTTKVTANSRIFLTINGGTLTNVGTPYVSARNAGTSFTITSTNSSDASDVAWLIIEPF